MVDKLKHEVARIGVSGLTGREDVNALIAEAKKRLRQQRNNEWELGYVILKLYREAPWRDSVEKGEVPAWAHFVRYLQVEQKVPVGDDERRVRAMMEVYAAWSRYRDEEIVAVIKEIGIWKPHIAIAYLRDICEKKDVEKAREIIAICRSNTASTLRDAIRTYLGRRGGGRPRLNGDERRAESAIAYIASSDNTLIAKRMFVPRHDVQEYHIEAAWQAVFQQAMKQLGLGVDATFELIMKRFAETLEPEIMDRARAAWEGVIEFQGYELQPGDRWPFDEDIDNVLPEAAE